MKKLAPYGKYLQALNKRDLAIIFIGQRAFMAAQDFQRVLPFTLCLPPRTSPLNYEWPIDGCHVYLVDTEQSQVSFIRFCALTFFGSGANKVTYISETQSFDIEKGN